MDNPHGWAPAVNKEWHVVEKLEVGRQLLDRRIVACSPFARSKGDFVDVGVELDISTSPMPNGHIQHSVQLTFVHVLQLLPVRIVQEVGNLFLICKGMI